jgi:hypothetical protein
MQMKKQLLMVSVAIVLTTSPYAKDKKNDFVDTTYDGTCPTFTTDNHEVNCGPKFVVIVNRNDPTFHGFRTSYGFTENGKPHTVEAYFFSNKEAFTQADGSLDYIIDGAAFQKDDGQPGQNTTSGTCNVNVVDNKDRGVTMYVDCQVKVTADKTSMAVHWKTSANIQPKAQ